MDWKKMEGWEQRTYAYLAKMALFSKTEKLRLQNLDSVYHPKIGFYLKNVINENGLKKKEEWEQ